MAKVTVRANPKTQEISVEVDGVQGPNCKNITAQFEALMGVEVSTDKKKEFFATNATSANA